MANNAQHAENGAASSPIEELCKAVFELEAYTDASEDKVQWTEIEHFCNLDITLKRKYEELEAKEKEFKEKETNALIVEKETTVAAKELDFLDRIQELKDAAVSITTEFTCKFQSNTCESSRCFGRLRHQGENTENMVVNVKPHPKLTQFCRQKDTKGLLNLGFYPPVETYQTMDATLQGMRKSCVVLIHAMASFLARIDPGADHLLNPKTKQQAKAIA
ncbi:Aspartyl protease family protein [Hibiscus syriacus]|uniref:Aspartyl protease family protein n=1 Tax=Hibiscus syriacus TaxID=106335 RepID=A0A6A2ZYI8_HIBSY|nr:Aspartyl protease family protein [Hibiscus syriacus]